MSENKEETNRSESVDVTMLAVEQTEEVTNKKCPGCGATVEYDPGTRGMLCKFCGYRKTLPAPEDGESISEIDFDQAETTESFNWGVEKKVVICKNCAGEEIYDALETAAVCSFCGSTNVMPAADEKSMAPGGVCPFTVPVDKAGGLFSKWLGKKIFTPKKAKLQARPEAFKGVYLPYWTFDTMTTSPFSGRAGYDKMVKRGDQTVMETDWRRVSGVYQESFNDYTVVGTNKNENSLVGRAEPFDFTKLVPYRPELMAGFGAERYSVGLKDAWVKAQEGIRSILYGKISQYICSAWRANRSDSIAFSTNFSKVTFKYILLPVWLSSFTYNGKLYQFVVNGQTGKVGGKAPVSALRVIIAIIIVLAIFGLLGYLMSL
jgi:DNA-directed RNA polymerase subunit RPC12/RpoP